MFVLSQMLGERLYPRVEQSSPLYCGKVTGMLLEHDNSEIVTMLEDNNKLQEKVRMLR